MHLAPHAVDVESTDRLPPPELFLELVDVNRQFILGNVKVQALAGISLQIGYGESVAVWGPSGSGKSTLMNLLGLIDTPDSGTVFFEGEDCSTWSDDALADFRNRKIGFVFQSFNLIPVLTALENVMLPLQLQGVADHTARQRAQQMLASVGLEPFIQFRPDRLSGGQRQRTAIARALVINPVLLIADEPTANLDSENSRSVIELIRSMSRVTGATCLFSTHDQRLLDQVPRHILLQDGQIAQDRRHGVDCVVAS